MSRCRRVCLALSGAILIALVAVPLTTHGGSWSGVFAVLAIPIFLSQIGYNSLTHNQAGLSQGVGPAGYVCGIVTWFIVLWLVLGLLLRLYRRFQSLRAEAQKQPPPES